MRWALSWRDDPVGRALADRHYNRQTPGASGFVAPSRCLVLTIDAAALWVSTWPLAEYTKHAWAGAWMCSVFRNEGAGLSSELIREAVAATRWKWGRPPALGMVTFVDETQVRPKRDPGRCFLRAGFQVVGRTKDLNLVALQMLPDAMPPAEAPTGAQLEAFA